MRMQWTSYLVGAALVGFGISIGLTAGTLEIRHLRTELMFSYKNAAGVNEVCSQSRRMCPRFEGSADGRNWVEIGDPFSPRLLQDLSFWDSHFRTRVLVADEALELCRIWPNKPYAWRITNK